MNPQEFIAKWRNIRLTERSAAQSHFNDLCQLVGHPTPIEDDPTGARFTFEAGANKQTGGQGWADVWKKNFFAWEYKGRHANLDKAYQQLLLYRESLQNPPLLVVCDLTSIIIHTNFTNTVKRTITITLDALLTPQGMRDLRAIFYEPEAFRAPQTTEQVTREAARQFARLAEHLHKRGEEPARIAHFLIRLLFSLFAEDIDLLPKGLFSRLVDQGRRKPLAFTQQLRQLFGAMAHGGFFGEHAIMHFDGGLFDSDNVLELDRDGLEILHGVAMLDWSNIEPSILGTLFERSLDPAKRAQLGAHYTSKDDILLIVEPVVMAPLRRRWAEVQAKARDLAQRRDETQHQGTRTQRINELNSLLGSFADEIANWRVLDPACGSGNFLYVALKLLLDLGKEVNQFAAEVKAGQLFPQANPAQLYGIEINEYAHELAQATVWIGYVQWLHENGYGVPSEPILKPLDNIKRMDAILAYEIDDHAVEPAWPETDVIIGNPPFLGGNKIRQELGDKYVDTLFTLYAGRVPAFSDLVCYWFERTRSLIESNKVKRAGLLATQGIRGGANRRVLERIKATGNIFWAQADRNWYLDGATVHVSMIGFDDGTESSYILDDQRVAKINPDLTALVDLTTAKGLVENRSICFMGPSPKAPFDIEADLAAKMLKAPININGRPNSDVIRLVFSAIDLVQRNRGKWTIDFALMSQSDASLYEIPFEYLKEHVYPVRSQNRRAAYAEKWWQYAEARPGMRVALKNKSRYIATPGVGKHRIFVWVKSEILCNQGALVFARDDDYAIGILQSTLHGLWARGTGTQLREAESGFRYTSTTTFETFPFPWPPGHEPQDDPRVQAVAQAAQELVTKRDAWLNPPGLNEKELQKRTLTNLYNARPTWLDLAHKKLDAAVFAAYGWPTDLSDEEISARLLALNLERAGRN